MSTVSLLIAAVLFLSGFLTGNVIKGPMTAATTTTIVITSTEVRTSSTTRTETKIVTSVLLLSTTPTVTSGNWREIKSFAGSSDATTEPFYVPSSMWRIRWSYGTSAYAGFWFFVYPLGETVMFVESVSSMMPSGSGTTYIYRGPGNFYLKITVSNVRYSIIVEVPA